MSGAGIAGIHEAGHGADYRAGLVGGQELSRSGDPISPVLLEERDLSLVGRRERHRRFAKRLEPDGATGLPVALYSPSHRHDTTLPGEVGPPQKTEAEAT